MKRHLLHTALLFCPPIAAFVVTYVIFHDSYLAVAGSYLVLLLFLQFIALEDFLLFREVQELWKAQAESVRPFVLNEAEFDPPILRVAPRVLLGDANLSNLARLKFLVGETRTVVATMRDEFKRLIFINIFLFFALMMIAPSKDSGSQMTNRTEPPAVEVPSPGSSPIAGSSNGPATSVTHAPLNTIDESIRVQSRLVISYFAVVLQLVWVGRLAFHYRQKNSDIFHSSAP